MTLPQIRPGDVALTSSGGLISDAINGIQRFWSQDNMSIYTHAMVCRGFGSDVFEANHKGVHTGNLSEYAGKPILIARHDDMDLALFQYAFSRLKIEYDGKPYPTYRLFLHLLPPLAKYFGVGLAVCSELAAKFLFYADILDYWQGVNPDELADMFHHWKGFNIIYEGVLPQKGELKWA